MSTCVVYDELGKVLIQYEQLHSIQKGRRRGEWVELVKDGIYGGKHTSVRAGVYRSSGILDKEIYI